MLVPSEFIYTANFPSLSDSDIQAAIDYIEAVWSGSLELFSGMANKSAKRYQLENLLIAWHLANLHPAATVGVIQNGGMPLSSKSIGGTSLAFQSPANIQDGLMPLMSNVFGYQAYGMITSATERYLVF